MVLKGPRLADLAVETPSSLGCHKAGRTLAQRSATPGVERAPGAGPIRALSSRPPRVGTAPSTPGKCGAQCPLAGLLCLAACRLPPPRAVSSLRPPRCRSPDPPSLPCPHVGVSAPSAAPSAAPQTCRGRTNARADEGADALTCAEPHAPGGRREPPVPPQAVWPRRRSHGP